MSALLSWLALMWLTGCATSGAVGRHSTFHDEALPPEFAEGDGVFGLFEKRDDFQLLQQSASLEEDSWHEVGEDLETDDAQELWEALARTQTTLQNFGPQRSLIYVLRQALARDEDVPYAELLQRIAPFRPLVVMRSDGYLVSSLTGKPLQRMGRVEVREGRLMAGAFEVGAFYRDKGGVFYAMDESLRQHGLMVGELGLERDWFNAALDGSEDALGELGSALAQFVTSPVRSLQGLQQLPSGVAALIASSPDYFARYSTLPLQEQIREAARLSTHLLMLYGSATGTATRLGAGAAELPVLTVSADGALAIEQVAVPGGTTAAVLGTGVGAVYILAESAKTPPEDNQRQVSGDKEGAGTLTPEQQRAIRSLEKQIQKHEEKLKKFRENPTPRPGTENLSQEIQRKSMEGRIRHLEREIETFKENIEKIRQGGTPE